ncbi:unnamed protein product, partial [Linum tenue]
LPHSKKGLIIMPIIRLITTTTTISLLILILSSTFSFPVAVASLDQRGSNNNNDNASNTTSWCDETPHPDTCRHYTSHVTWPHGTQPGAGRSEFRIAIIEATLGQALDAARRVYRWKSRARTHAERATWIDCIRFHVGTVRQLNRTLHGLRSPKSCTDFDAQTWLSTSLTNLETCLTGSADLNATDWARPMMSANLSQLISNTLAVNGGLLRPQDEDEEDVGGGETASFPKWFGARQRRRLLQQQPSLGSASVRGNLVVAKDGSGHYRTVQAAIDRAKRRRYRTRFVIRVKSGVYRENIEVDNDNGYIWLIGDGVRNTIITGDRSVGGGYTTYSSATAGIEGPRFVARGITFRNTAGPRKGQAVALRSTSDLSVFYQCNFEGYQDTLFVHSQRQFFRDCTVSGTIDFIFGNAAVVFQNCVISPRRPLPGQANMITAQGRNDPFQNTGISIHNSRIVPAPDLLPVVRAFKTYLGRPWMQYARTVVVRSYVDRFVYPAGWSKWQENNDFAINTLYFGEYGNYGPGASTRFRVRWKGYHAIRERAEASRFTVNGLIAGRAWLPPTGVPFALGL